MNKKILIGSIGAAIIIILTSFSSAVGVKDTESAYGGNSPLYDTRLQSTVNSKGGVAITSEYLGKGETSNICVPEANGPQVPLQKIINKISKMNDNQFKGFLDSVIARLIAVKCIEQEDAPKVVNSLNYARSNPSILKGVSLEENEKEFGVSGFTFYGAGPILCTIQIILGVLFIIFVHIPITIFCFVFGPWGITV